MASDTELVNRLKRLREAHETLTEELAQTRAELREARRQLAELKGTLQQERHQTDDRARGLGLPGNGSP
jgi:septal ring factor EnvC (AmiA/AmiB activator)